MINKKTEPENQHDEGNLVEIAGKKQEYDFGCSEEDFEFTKEMHYGYTYLGASAITYEGGVKNISEETKHYFIQK